MSGLREMRRQAEGLADFAAQHGHEVTNALQNQARHMREAADQAQECVTAAEADPNVAARYDASVVTVNGYRRMAAMFTEAAAKAEAALDAWENLSDPDPEEEQ